MTATRCFSSFLLIVSLALFVGCAHQSETVGESEGSAAQPQLIQAPINDSLMAENQRLREQINALAAENRSLTLKLEQQPAHGDAGAQSASTYPAAVAAPSQEALKLSTYPPPSKITAESQKAEYDAAVAMVQRKEYKDAVSKLENLLISTVGTDLNDNCHYWLGEAYLAQKKYEYASEEFLAVINFPGSDMINESKFMLGNTYVAAGKIEDARQAYNDLIKTAPKSPLAKKAQAKLDHLK